MRIWIINHYAMPPTHSGGTRHYDFAEQLIRRGHEVTIIASNYNHFTHTFIPSECGKIDVSSHVPFIWIPTPSYSGNTFARFWNMLCFSFRVLKKKYLPRSSPPDIIIGSSPHLFSALSAELLARRFKIPFILEVRDIWPETLVDLGRISPIHPLILMMKMVERYLYKRADRIISLLSHAKNYFSRYGVKPENVLWIPNAIGNQCTLPNSELSPQKKFTIMYAGAHGLANDLETVLKAAKMLQAKGFEDKIRICLVGDGPDKLRLKEIAYQEMITMVQFVEAVPKKEIYHVLNKADVFLMLLKKSQVFRWGISPNKLFDYLLIGRPIIFGVDTPYNPIQKYNAGITILPSDHESLANAIHTLFHLSDEDREAMGAQGKKFVMENHHIKVLTDRLEDSLHQLLTRRID